MRNKQENEEDFLNFESKYFLRKLFILSDLPRYGLR